MAVSVAIVKWISRSYCLLQLWDCHLWPHAGFPIDFYLFIKVLHHPSHLYDSACWKLAVKVANGKHKTLGCCHGHNFKLVAEDTNRNHVPTGTLRRQKLWRTVVNLLVQCWWVTSNGHWTIGGWMRTVPMFLCSLHCIKTIAYIKYDNNILTVLRFVSFIFKMSLML